MPKNKRPNNDDPNLDNNKKPLFIHLINFIDQNKDKD